MNKCSNCKYSQHIYGDVCYLCMGQKNMPVVFPNDTCENWKADRETNADKIRQMTDEELADFIGGIFTLDSDVWGDYDPRTVVMQEPRVEVRNKEEMLEWLKQEVESDG